MRSRRPKGTSRTSSTGFNIGGGLIQNKASFFSECHGNSAYETPNSSIARPTGTTIETLKPARATRVHVRQRRASTGPPRAIRRCASASTADDSSNRNQGIGGYNEPERAFTAENQNNTFRAQEVGPLGRRFFINTRLNVGWTDSGRQIGSSRAPTIRILDAQTSGGAQKAGGRHSRDVKFASDLDYVRGMHSVRVGTADRLNWFRSDEATNYLGTYTFESLDAFKAGRPRSYTRRIGDPNIRYVNLQGAFYVQDDIRIRRNLSVTPGVRIETQNHIKGVVNRDRRVGATWAPFRNGKTTLRASWGIFYDWLHHEHLRTDAPRRRIPAAGNQHRESLISGYPAGDRGRDAGRSLSARSGTEEPEELARQCRRRLRVLAAVSRERDLSLHQRRGAAARTQSECASQRRSPVTGVRQHHSGGGRREIAAACAATSAARRTCRRSWDGTARRWDFRRFNFFGNYT